MQANPFVPSSSTDTDWRGISLMASSGLQEAVSALVPRLSHAAIAIARGEDTAAFALASAPGVSPLTPNTAFRAASMSKIVTGQAVWSVLSDHDGSADADVAGILGVPLRHPAGAGVTPRQLLCHCGGLWDDAGYAWTPGQSIGPWLESLGQGIWSPDPPGSIYRYCNLGYILAAACAERLANRRFDELAGERVLGQHGISAGFNWAGMGASARTDRIPCYRRDAAGLFQPQIDEAVAGSGASGPGGEAIDLARMAPGNAGLALSPQGGLRISLENALRLARALPRMRHDRLWSPSMWKKDDPTGLVDAYGAGLMFHDSPDFYPEPLVGHFANAYGFCGGLWYDATRDAAFVIAINGLSVGEDADDLRPEERHLFDAVSRELYK